MTKELPTRLSGARWLILVGFGLLIAALPAQYWILHAIRVAVNETDLHSQIPLHIPDENTALAEIALLAVPGVVMALIGFFLGMARIRRAAEQAGLTGYAYSFGWTVASAFVPLLNFYRPLVGLAETRRSIFNALETRQRGKRWNKFGDFSSATVTLAVLLAAIAALAIAYDVASPVPTARPDNALQFYGLLDSIGIHIVINMAFLMIGVAALFAYFETLRGPSLALTRLADEGALSSPP